MCDVRARECIFTLLLFSLFVFSRWRCCCCCFCFVGASARASCIVHLPNTIFMSINLEVPARARHCHTATLQRARFLFPAPAPAPVASLLSCVHFLFPFALHSVGRARMPFASSDRHITEKNARDEMIFMFLLNFTRRNSYKIIPYSKRSAICAIEREMFFALSPAWHFASAHFLGAERREPFFRGSDDRWHETKVRIVCLAFAARR